MSDCGNEAEQKRHAENVNAKVSKRQLTPRHIDKKSLLILKHNFGNYRKSWYSNVLVILKSGVANAAPMPMRNE